MSNWWEKTPQTYSDKNCDFKVYKENFMGSQAERMSDPVPSLKLTLPFLCVRDPNYSLSSWLPRTEKTFSSLPIRLGSCLCVLSRNVLTEKQDLKFTHFNTFSLAYILDHEHIWNKNQAQRSNEIKIWIPDITELYLTARNYL